jgi:hypothetical protein
MYGVNIVANCYVYDVFAFFHGPNVVHDTYMSWMNSGEDTAVHENGIYCFGSCTGFNNVIHDFIGVQAIYWETYDGTGTVPSTVYFYNNVLWNASQPFLAEPDRAPSGGPYKDVQNIWNNTIFAPGGNCVRTTPRGTNSGTWNLHNNHCISNQSLSVSYVSANSTTFNLPASNILMATATATSGGYSATETFAFSPSTSNSPTLTVQGENLSSSCSGSAAAACWDTSYANGRAPSQRTSSGSWNVGAYAVAGGSRGGNAVNPPTALSAVVN